MANDTFIATKEELYRFVEGLTERYDEKNEPEFTTSSISEKLNISRNLASQYLNEFVKEQVFVKVNSRPVYFFDKRTLEKKYEIRLEQTVFFSITEGISFDNDRCICYLCGRIFARETEGRNDCESKLGRIFYGDCGDCQD